MAKRPTISLIIPAHNEARTIEAVVASAKASTLLDEIIVVADACTDDTAAIARSLGVIVLEKETTRGKGDAMIAGFEKSNGDIIMFADADLENFTADHIERVLTPVISGEAVMSIGLRDRVWGLGALIPRFFPNWAIGGERAMTREFFASLPLESLAESGFGDVVIMNYEARHRGLAVAYPILSDLHQVIKEKKWGWRLGLIGRWKLTRQIASARKIMKQRGIHPPL